MLVPSKKIHIAVQAVLYIACAGTQQPVRSRDICAYQGVTLRYLEHILQQLVHDKILKGVRGPKGGYLLASDRRKIRIADIAKSVRALIQKDEVDESQLATRITHQLVADMQRVVDKAAESITIQDLYDDAQASGIDLVQGKKSDFVI